jgi:hypothetical protein
MSERVQIILTGLPDETRAALAGDAEERDMSRNEVVVQALADYLGVKHEPRSSRWRPVPTSSGPVSFEVPKKIRDRLRITAARKGATMQGLVRLALAERYGLPTEAPTRKPRTAPQPEESPA